MSEEVSFFFTFACELNLSRLVTVMETCGGSKCPNSMPVTVLRMIKGGDVGKGCLGMIQIAAPTRQCWQVGCA